jgi:hypothetical protein
VDHEGRRFVDRDELQMTEVHLDAARVGYLAEERASCGSGIECCTLKY